MHTDGHHRFLAAKILGKADSVPYRKTVTTVGSAKETGLYDWQGVEYASETKLESRGINLSGDSRQSYVVVSKNINISAFAAALLAFQQNNDDTAAWHAGGKLSQEELFALATLSEKDPFWQKFNQNGRSKAAQIIGTLG